MQLQRCDRCNVDIEPGRVTCQVVTEGLPGGRRVRVALCEACAVAFAAWLGGARSPGDPSVRRSGGPAA
ncbi:MAG: hypothetical protein WKF75_00400 [Singulisphaera sp.]